MSSSAAGVTGVTGSSRARWLFHLCLLLSFAAVGGGLLVWPQRLALDGARAALEIQREREEDYQDRLEAARTMALRLQSWRQDIRKVFLAEELSQYPELVREIAKQAGAGVGAVQVTRRSTARWRFLRMQAGSWVDDMDSGDEIQPRAVRIVLTGSFESLFRTVACLSQQQQLFIPDRWELASHAKARKSPGTELQAEIWGTLFVVSEQVEKKTLFGMPPSRRLSPPAGLENEG